MCRYMFIWAVCPTTVEMDLTFVLLVRFIIAQPITQYMYGPFHCSQANERAKSLDECVG